eukprot:Rmarinus@m.9895
MPYDSYLSRLPPEERSKLLEFVPNDLRDRLNSQAATSTASAVDLNDSKSVIPPSSSEDNSVGSQSRKASSCVIDSEDTSTNRETASSTQDTVVATASRSGPESEGDKPSAPATSVADDVASVSIAEGAQRDGNPEKENMSRVPARSSKDAPSTLDTAPASVAMACQTDLSGVWMDNELERTCALENELEKTKASAGTANEEVEKLNQHIDDLRSLIAMKLPTAGHPADGNTPTTNQAFEKFWQSMVDEDLSSRTAISKDDLSSIFPSDREHRTSKLAIAQHKVKATQDELKLVAGFALKVTAENSKLSEAVLTHKTKTRKLENQTRVRLTAAVRRLHYVLSQYDKSQAALQEQRTYLLRLEHKVVQQHNMISRLRHTSAKHANENKRLREQLRMVLDNQSCDSTAAVVRRAGRELEADCDRREFHNARVKGMGEPGSFPEKSGGFPPADLDTHASVEHTLCHSDVATCHTDPSTCQIRYVPLPEELSGMNGCTESTDGAFDLLPRHHPPQHHPHAALAPYPAHDMRAAARLLSPGGRSLSRSAEFPASAFVYGAGASGVTESYPGCTGENEMHARELKHEQGFCDLNGNCIDPLRAQLRQTGDVPPGTPGVLQGVPEGGFGAIAAQEAFTFEPLDNMVPLSPSQATQTPNRRNRMVSDRGTPEGRRYHSSNCEDDADAAEGMESESADCGDKLKESERGSSTMHTEHPHQTRVSQGTPDHGSRRGQACAGSHPDLESPAAGEVPQRTPREGHYDCEDGGKDKGPTVGVASTDIVDPHRRITSHPVAPLASNTPPHRPFPSAASAASQSVQHSEPCVHPNSHQSPPLSSHNAPPPPPMAPRPCSHPGAHAPPHAQALLYHAPPRAQVLTHAPAYSDYDHRHTSTDYISRPQNVPISSRSPIHQHIHQHVFHRNADTNHVSAHTTFSPGRVPDINLRAAAAATDFHGSQSPGDCKVKRLEEIAALPLDEVSQRLRRSGEGPVLNDVVRARHQYSNRASDAAPRSPISIMQRSRPFLPTGGPHGAKHSISGAEMMVLHDVFSGGERIVDSEVSSWMHVDSFLGRGLWRKSVG